MNTEKNKIDNLIAQTTKKIVHLINLLTNFKRHVFSLSAPTQPANDTINTTPPENTITREIFNIMS